ncbi:hypothetical protein CSC2_04420 [Clostridium zeae]|uniref:DUF2812 domain-containing protein n=1 Tax=Clostridium zeae TaxID=2759022 RepID=A0ABQ1E5B0_9CLOT|nr:DUF2812 domain-containing protein [Clostridium zeae]GFZ29916.1 hypothetical protein CSC2_04420 [Clostridium zeae]
MSENGEDQRNTCYIKVINGNKGPNELIKIKKNRFFIYYPSKVEKWIEEMEEKGFLLNEINRRGNIFSFTRGEKRKAKCFVDLPDIIDKDYFRTYIKLGWKPIYNTRMLGGKMVLWMKSENQGDVCSEVDFLNSNKRLTKNMLKVITSNLVNFLIALYFFVNMLATVCKSPYLVDMFYIGLNTFSALLAFSAFCFLHGSIAYFVKLKSL